MKAQKRAILWELQEMIRPITAKQTLRNITGTSTRHGKTGDRAIVAASS